MNLPSLKKIQEIQQEAAKIVQERIEKRKKLAQEQKRRWENFDEPQKKQNQRTGLKTSSGKKGSSPYKQEI